MAYPVPILLRDAQSAEALRDICREIKLNGKIMIEIGCYAGDSTAVFAEFCKTLYAIDPWKTGMSLADGSSAGEVVYMYPNVEEAFDEKMKAFPNVIKMKNFDHEVIDSFKKRTIDFIYIDALHTEEEMHRQLEMWLPKIKESGIIGGHDFNEHFPGIVRAVLDVIGAPDRVYTDNGNSWIKYKKSL
jgi:hypothetical protein